MIRKPGPHVVEIIIYLVVIFLLTAGTYSRNGVWNSGTELWIDCLKKSPNKERPHYNLGSAFARQGKYQEAIHHLTEALRIKPNYEGAHYNLATVFAQQGKYEEASHHFGEEM